MFTKKRLLGSTPLWLSLLRYPMMLALFGGLAFAGNFKPVGDQLAKSLEEVTPDLKTALATMQKQQAESHPASVKSPTLESTKCR